MKRCLKTWVVLIVVLITISGCSGKKSLVSLEKAGAMTEEQLKQELAGFSREEMVDVQNFEGIIEEIHGSNALVAVDEGFPIYSSGSMVSVTLEEDGSAAQEGDRVRVLYSGPVMETYPLQLTKQISIELLAKEEYDRIPRMMLDGCLYRSTGETSDVEGRCGAIDGKIESSVGGSENPQNEPSVIKTYEVTDSEHAFEDDELVTMVKYYEMSDGTWRTDEQTYKYRFVITGRMGAAVKDTTFVFLSNLEEITFEQAWKASGLSSNMNDYFKEEDARFVALR